MTDDTTARSDSSVEEPTETIGDTGLTHGTTTYKVLGELAAEDGTGVLGHNTAGSGAAIGVQGVTDSPDGYGLSTPDDAGVAGVTELAAVGGSLTGGTQVSDLIGTGLTVDSSGALTWDRTYDTYTFAASGTTTNAITGLSGATPVEVTVDANDLTDGKIAVDVDGSLRAEAINGVLHRILEPTMSVTLRSADYFTFDTSFGISEDGGPQGIAFESDGSGMFIVGTSNDTVYTYGLTTPWDVDTASYSGDSFSISDPDWYPVGVRFKPDGTKMFLLNGYAGNEVVYSYRLPTAWDVTSATDVTTFDISGRVSSPAGIAFGDAGSKMVVISGIGTVYVFDLPTAWDLDTVQYSGVTTVLPGQTEGAGDIAFGPNGTKLYVVDDTDTDLYSYVLGAQWDVTSAGFPTSMDISGQVERGEGLAIKGDQSKLFVTGVIDDNVVQYARQGYGGTAYAAVEMEGYQP